MQFCRNGRRTARHAIKKACSTDEIDWLHVRHPDLIDVWADGDLGWVSDEEYFVYGSEQRPFDLRAEYLRSTLQIGEVAGVAIYLVNPRIVTADGEWEAWVFAA